MKHFKVISKLNIAPYTMNESRNSIKTNNFNKNKSMQSKKRKIYDNALFNDFIKITNVKKWKKIVDESNGEYDFLIKLNQENIDVEMTEYAPFQRAAEIEYRKSPPIARLLPGLFFDDIKKITPTKELVEENIKKAIIRKEEKTKNNDKRVLYIIFKKIVLEGATIPFTNEFSKENIPLLMLSDDIFDMSSYDQIIIINRFIELSGRYVDLIITSNDDIIKINKMYAI